MRFSLTRWLDVAVASTLIGFVIAEMITNLSELESYFLLIPAFQLYAGLLVIGNLLAHLLGILYAFFLCIFTYVWCDIGSGYWFLHEFHDSWVICAVYGFVRMLWEITRQNTIVSRMKPHNEVVIAER